MRELTAPEAKFISGSGKIGSCTWDDYQPQYIVVTPPVQPTNPIKLAIDAGTAATLGATAGLLAGGPVGAFTGAIFAATGVAIATMVNDAYNMYEAAKKK